MLNKLEIDVMQANELCDSVNLAVKYRMSAIVVHQDLAGEAFIVRAKAGGKFRIITSVDWPKGTTFGMAKMRGLSIDALEVEGFEILLTGGMNTTETRNEAKVLTEFVKQHLGDYFEIRFVLGTQIRDTANIISICEALRDVRTPTLIRNDAQTKLQVSKANPEIHNATTEMIRKIVRTPLKISGNINGLKAMLACQDVAKFGVNLTQAKSIIKEYNQQPTDQIRELLVASAEAEANTEANTETEVEASVEEDA